jgi:RNA polymerase sigma-70 factor (ECF subfamily)
MDDRSAILRLKHGDIGGLQTLVERYQIRALRTAYLITQDRQQAEEIVQDTFIRIYQRIHQFDESRAFEPWFLRSVANAAIRSAQRATHEVSLDTEADWADLLPDPAHGPETAAEAAELETVVHQALRQLTPEQRGAVVLRYYLGYTHHEIAEETGSPEGTVKWRLHTARLQLRNRLGHLKEQTDG